MSPPRAAFRFSTALLTLAISACGPAPEARPSSSNALSAAFDQAARDYQVPRELLLSLGYTETRLSPQAGLESASGGVGLMQLARRDGVDAVAEAARLTGATEGQLRVDPVANIIGAAAVLRARFDESRERTPALDATKLGDWYLAVSYYPGFDSVVSGYGYASEVFLTLERGFSVDGLGVFPTSSQWRQYAPAVEGRKDSLQEYPQAAAWVPSPNFSNGRQTYEFIIIHTMQGSYAGTKSWFQNSASRVSAHYLVRSSDGEITQMVEHDDTAFHAQCYNNRSIGLEHEGYVQDPTRWYTDAMYEESAKLTRWIADRHNIPKTRSHIIGHADVAPGCNTNGHTDPGSGWNWTRYMQLVTNGAPTGSTGVFIGAIYTQGSTTNRVSGATVTIGSQTVTTGADGLFQFTLAPGSYTATVTKSGFGSNSITRTVVANQQVWGSMEITATTVQTGTLAGRVYVSNPSVPGDTSVNVSGATVTVGSQSVTTSSDGAFSFTLAPGTYTVSASKSGYVTSQLTRAVNAGATTQALLPMTTAGSADTVAPQVSITFPGTGATLDLARVDVRGTASDDRGPVGSVQVSVNGGEPVTAPVSAGVFQVALSLVSGPNTIEVSAVDAASNRASVSSTVTFAAGVRGFVYEAGDEDTRLEGVSVQLFRDGAPVASGTSDLTGSYSVKVDEVPADYLVVARKTGYITSSQTITAPEDGKLVLDIALTPGNDKTEEASLTFVEPVEGAQVNTDTVAVYGVVKGFDLSTVTVAGVTAELLGAGGFSASVPLSVGENTLVAVATGVTGQTVSATLRVTRLEPMVEPKPMKTCGCAGSGAELLVALGALSFAARRRRVM